MQLTKATPQKEDVSPTQSGKSRERFLNFLRNITSNPKITFGLGVVAFFLLVAIFAPLLTPYAPEARTVTGLHPAVAPSWSHPFGTTDTGEDMFSQVVYGARVTLAISSMAAIGSTLLQIIFGLSAAYFGGLVDDVLSLIINVFLVLPSLPLTIVLGALASSIAVNQNEFVIAFVLLFTSWSYGARVLRSQTLSVKARDFIDAARATGENPFRIIFAEILPNEIALVSSTFIGTFVYAIGAEVALEFLGLGNPAEASWGSILYWAQNNSALPAGQWWQFVPAGICLALFCGGLAFINFGIDEIANPRLRQSKAEKLTRKMIRLREGRRA